MTVPHHRVEAARCLQQAATALQEASEFLNVNPDDYRMAHMIGDLGEIADDMTDLVMKPWI